MPYLDPEHVLQRFAKYLQDDVRDAIDDDREFVHAQVGSMSSSLRFLAMELGTLGEDVDAQRRALLEALEDAEAILEGIEGTEAVETSLESARKRVRTADATDVYALERTVTGAATDVLETVDDELDETEAGRVRQPLYEFMDVRVKTQLEAIGADREL